MNKRVRILSFLLFLVLLLPLLTGIETASRTSVVLYKNDTKFTSYPEYPAEYIAGELYVPIYFLLDFKNIKYEYIPKSGGFYFTNTQSGAYLSFKPDSTKLIITDGVFVEKELPLMNGTRYLPLHFACGILGLSVEYGDNNSRVRVMDGTQKMSFSALIDLFDPPKVVLPDPIPDPIPDPVPDPIPDPIPDPEPTHENSYVYLTFENAPNEYTPEILDTLKKYGAKAIFFCEKEKIYENPRLLYRIFVEGHTVGLHSDASLQETLTSSISAIVTELEAANKALETVLKCRSRLYRFPSGSDNKIIGNPSWQTILSRRGYLIWDWTLDSGDADPALSADRISAAVIRHIENNAISVIRFSSEKNTARALGNLLSHIGKKNYLFVEQIDETTEQINFLHT